MTSSTLVKMKISSSYAYMDHNDWLHYRLAISQFICRTYFGTFSLKFDLKNSSSEAGIDQPVKAFSTLWKAKLLYSLSEKPASGPYHFFSWHDSPQLDSAASFKRSQDHTQRRTSR